MKRVFVGSLALFLLAQIIMCFLHGFYALPRTFRALHFVAMALAIASAIGFASATPREPRLVRIGAVCYALAILVDVLVVWQAA
jgi:hypothetical protein